MSYFYLPSIVLEQLRSTRELTLVLSDLVKFLVPGFKALQQPFSLRIKLHILLSGLEICAVEKNNKAKDIISKILESTSKIILP